MLFVVHFVFLSAVYNHGSTYQTLSILLMVSDKTVVHFVFLSNLAAVYNHTSTYQTLSILLMISDKTLPKNYSFLISRHVLAS